MKRLLYVDCCIGAANPEPGVWPRHFRRLTAHLEDRNSEPAGRRTAVFFRPVFPATAGPAGRRKSGAPRFRYAWQFARADAIVLAALLWDLSFPALLKVYIEQVSVEGITFGCGEAGCYGICHASRMVFLTTRETLMKALT